MYMYMISNPFAMLSLSWWPLCSSVECENAVRANAAVVRAKPNTIKKNWHFLILRHYGKHKWLAAWGVVVNVIVYGVEFLSTYAKCMYDSRMWQGVLDTTLLDKVSKWLTEVSIFLPDCPVLSTNKTDHHVIILKVVTSNTLTLTVIRVDQLIISDFYVCHIGLCLHHNFLVCIKNRHSTNIIYLWSTYGNKAHTCTHSFAY